MPTEKWWYARFRVGEELRRFPLTRKVAGKEERIPVRGQRPVSLKNKEGADGVFMDSHHQAMAAFLDAESARGISARTWNVTLGLLKSVFSKLEPSSDAYTQFLRNAKSRMEDTVHREPFSSEEVARILEAARKDDVLRGPVHVACFTALRKGDACCLKWDTVDLKAGIIRTRTSKTGEWVEIPIMPPLAEELAHHPQGKGEFVFPEAAKLYRDAKRPSVLDKRFKDILRAAGFAKRTWTRRSAPALHCRN